MSEFSFRMKALTDTNRLRALAALRKGEMCVCQVVELLQLAPSTVSKHMNILKQAGLVDSEKRGRWVYYRLPEEPRSPGISATLDWVLQSLSQLQEVAQDEKNIKTIIRIEPEELCRLQSIGQKVCCPDRDNPRAIKKG
jgi:DNA-binding transcriptional ArsR family regulator